jgi:hypothetical protein
MGGWSFRPLVMESFWPRSAPAGGRPAGAFKNARYAFPGSNRLLLVYAGALPSVKWIRSDGPRLPRRCGRRRGRGAMRVRSGSMRRADRAWPYCAPKKGWQIGVRLVTLAAPNTHGATPTGTRLPAASRGLTDDNAARCCRRRLFAVCDALERRSLWWFANVR